MTFIIVDDVNSNLCLVELQRITVHQVLVDELEPRRGLHLRKLRNRQ